MLKCQRSLFSITKEYVYLNCAYMSPLLKSSHDAGMEMLIKQSFPQEVAIDDFFTPPEQLRKAFAQLINANSSDRIAIVSSASYGIANAANNIPLEAQDNIIVMDEQFPSHVYVWQKLAAEKNANLISIAPPTTSENRGKIWNERLLSAINDKTKVVAIGTIHWADGTLFDLKAIRRRTREVGAYLILDGTQSVGALPFDVQEIEPDALICSGYKWLLGPYSLGVAYYGSAFDNGTPIEENWMNRKDSHVFQDLVNYQPNYRPEAQRYNMGGLSSFIHVPMLTDSIRQLNEWGVEEVNDYCHRLIQKPLRQLKNLGCSLEHSDYYSPHLLGVRMPKGISMERLQDQLQKDRIKVSIRGNSMRIAPNVYNDRSDFDRLIESFKKVIKE
ncbi:MAG: aminotransferase class V-fold PLP-dependent enzyme [Saprospiraceae bacterium]